MSEIKIYIKKSNIPDFQNNSKLNIKLTKCLGYGSYGFIFKTNFKDYAIKLLLDPDDTYDSSLTDFTEPDVIEKIIDSEKKFEVNNYEYGVGHILRNEKKTNENEKIYLYVNELETNFESYVMKKKKRNVFVIKEFFKIILMKTFIPIFSLNSDFIQESKYVCKLIDSLIKAINELLLLNLINMDIKITNAVIDSSGDFRFIDFGLVKDISRMYEPFYNRTKYYIWPSKCVLTEKCLPHMICMFILDIFYFRIHSLKHNKNLIIKVIDNYANTGVREELIILIRDTIFFEMNWKMFIERFEELKKNYDIDNLKIPFD